MIEIEAQRPVVMVTGANGFVGEALVTSLTQRNFSVRRSVRHKSSNPSYDESEFISGDINGSTDWMRGLKGVDVVVHTAARVHVMDEQSSDPITEFRSVNVHGSANLARQAARSGVKRLIYLSSVKVNGESSTEGYSLKASDTPSPLGAYAISKSEAELELLEVALETGLEVVIIRPPLIYGKGVKANFASLIHAIRKGIPLPFGMVTNNRRSLVSLDNLIDFIEVCLEHTAAGNETFMISDGQDISTADLVKQIGNALCKKIILIPVPVFLLNKVALIFGKQELMERLTGNLQVDINKNFLLLDWRPKLSLDEGLLKTLDDTNH